MAPSVTTLPFTTISSSLIPHQPRRIIGRIPHLPYDIVAAILEEHIPQVGAAKKCEQLAQFASFAYVSSEWYAYVIPRLYADIVFSDVFSSWSQQRLCETLQGTPRLAAYVRSCWATSGKNNRYDQISLFELPIFAHAISNMAHLALLQLRMVDVTTLLLNSVAQNRTLKTLSLIQCLCVATIEEQHQVMVQFRLDNFTMLGSPILGNDVVISKLFNTDTIEYLMMDSQVTGIGLRSLSRRSLARLRYLYAEPCKDDTELFCQTLARCRNLVRLGFSHGSKSLPLEDAPFLRLGSVPALGHLTHWTGPSNLLPHFLRKGHHQLQHVVMDQLITSDRDEGAPYVELLRPRNLSTSPEVESTRISAIQALVSEPSTLRTLDVVLASSHSVKEVFANCRVPLFDLRVKCTETEGHTVSTFVFSIMSTSKHV